MTRHACRLSVPHLPRLSTGFHYISRPRPPLSWLLGCLICCSSLGLSAHKANQSYVYLRVMEDSITGVLQVSVEDLNKALELRLDRDMTDEQLREVLPILYAYFEQRTSFASEQGRHPLRFTGQMRNLRLDRLGLILGLEFVLENVTYVPDRLDIGYRGIYHADPTHRGFTIIEYNWKAGIHGNESIISQKFGPGDEGPKELDLTDVSIWKGFRAMVGSGMYHIYIGLDHILFLLALVLPAVVYRTEEGTWRPVTRFRPAFIYVLKIVTFFTIAHTITLSLAALGWVNLPSYLVESLIALSIALAAAHNLRPLMKNDGVIIAFVFGLFHGFGFASVLSDVGLRGEYMTLSLLGFNVGVELAQVLVICLSFPILYLLRRLWIYRYLLVGGSLALIAIALYWFIERFFGINIPGYDAVYWVQDLL